MAKAVRAIAKATLSRQMEDKHAVWNVISTNHNSSIGTNDCTFPLQPISQGVDSDQRIGDRIRPKWFKISGTVAIDTEFINGEPAPVSFPLDPLEVRVMCLTQKDVKCGASGPIQLDPAHLLRKGGGVAYTGGLYDNQMPVNTDKFKVLFDRKIRLVPQQGLNQNAVLPQQYKDFSFKIKCPAVFSFDAGNQNWVNNFAPFVCLGYNYPSGRGADVQGAPVKLSYTSHLIFEDA